MGNIFNNRNYRPVGGKSEAFMTDLMTELKNNKKWFAVHTRPLWEKKVSALFDSKRIENYSPLIKVERQWSDRKKIIATPLFTSYVFVRIAEDEKLPVLQTEGVMNFVHWLKKPAIIHTEEIEVIRRFLNENRMLSLEKAVVNVNDKIRILNGPLMEREGNILEIKHKTIKVLLPSLGYTLVVEIEKTNVEILSLIPRSDLKIAQ